MAIYAIGDIHGSSVALKNLFALNVIKPDDTVVFLGDYVDRGPDTKGVLEWLINNKKNFHFEFILGNHEIMMTTAKSDPAKLIEWLHFGGASTLDSYNIGDDANWADKIATEHWNLIESCKPYFETDKYIFVHAGLENGKPLTEQNKHSLFWKKYEMPVAYSDNRIVICGHTSRKNGKIANFGHTICIDTYAHGGMWLTCLNVTSGEYLQANNAGECRIGKLE